MTESRSDSPVFIIGTERSGSNLLRLILDAHSRLAIPHPPHFMRYLAPLAPYYGDLGVDANRMALTEDALLLLRWHIHPWPYPIDADRVVATAGPTMLGVVVAIYEQYRIAVGKARWGCKSTFMVRHVDEALGEYPAAKFIWLVRDPRDVASSAKRSVFGPSDPCLMARLWNAEQRLGIEALRKRGPDVVHLVRYEDLVCDPKRAVAALCDFIGERVEPNMFEHHRSSAARYTAALSESWSNAAKPISSSRIGGHSAGLTKRERSLVDQVTADLRSELGFPVEAAAPAVTEPSTALLLVRSAGLRALIEYRSMRKDANHRRRVARNLIIVWLRVKARTRRASPTREATRHRRLRQAGRSRLEHR